MSAAVWPEDDSPEDAGRTARASTRPAVRVSVVAEDAITRAGLLEHLRVERWTVVVEGDEPADVAVAAAAALGPRAVELVRRSAGEPGTPVVLVTTTPVGALRDGELLAAVEAGVVAVIPRAELTSERLLRAVTTASQGGGDLPSTLQGQLLREVLRVQHDVLAPHGLSASGLSEREVDVLRLLADGLDLKEIAAQLAFSERTVKNVLYTLLQRLGLRNRVQAVSYALRAGLI